MPEHTPRGALPKAVTELADMLGGLPGLGPRTALSAAMAIAKGGRPTAEALASGIRTANRATRRCAVCTAVTDQDLCGRCRQPGRTLEQICVVQRTEDAEAIEESGRYLGSYHILHGCLDPISGVGPEQLTMSELMERARAMANNPTAEIILAVGTTLEGSMTADFLAKWIQSTCPNLTVTELGRGLAERSQIEFADETTVRHALTNRSEAEGEGG